MARLGRDARLGIQEIEAALRPFGRPRSVLDEQVLPTLGRLLEAPAVAFYDIESTSGGLRLGDISSRGMPRQLEPMFRGVLERSSGWGFYDAKHPQARQRNRALTRHQLSRGRTESAKMQRFYAAAGLEGLDFLRALLCDGALPLAWVGGMRTTERFDERQRHVLQALVPSLHGFALARRRLERSADGLLFDALFDAVPQAAFVFDARGRITRANDAGRALLELQPTLRANLEADARRGTSRVLALRPVEAPGLPCYQVGLVRPEPNGCCEAVARARARWGLTPREAQVLRELIDGLTNKEIGARLGCSPLTVEVHVSRLLDKAQRGNRGALVAAVFRLV